MCVLIGNEPRAYRDVIALAIRALRPVVDVVAVDPEKLDAAIIRLDPALVICSRLSPFLEMRRTPWILLYPGGSAETTVCIAGERSAVPAIDFEHILAIVDRLSDTAQAS